MANDGIVTAPDGSGRQVKLITADDVVAYLKAHPDFFTKQAELAAELGLSSALQGPGVIDMQQAILKRLRGEIDRLKSERTEIIANSKQNQIVQNRIQAAVISIIQAPTFEKMIQVVTHDLPELLDVDFITLAIEANADAPRKAPVRGIYVLAPGAIDVAIGEEKHARLRSNVAGEEAFFGDVARFVQSDVLLRLRVSTGSPDGVMCFGSRNPEAFGPDMATELLFFLAKVLENTIRAWLDLPE
ncbi:hypothetical protein SAMN02745126_02337 [Enhydrobacter aerosaccus]|uniref:DUF484 family protein n=1 Tax=Enhydrobacter aerosaccus TaxID=225324 RepID=A0A1T4NLG0_9HYPH|nr:DUF484 family protein [Enhydrobacter aerosaccus]SJZ79955.1 hypothetical protein SAMN02745126_02337 [Enhydrobacter aerosaccus]